MAQFIKILLFVLLFVCCTLCLPVYANNQSEAEKESVDLFVPEKEIKELQDPYGDEISDDIIKSITPKKIKLPLLHFVAAKGGLMVAVAETIYTENGGSEGKKVDVLAKYFQTENKSEWGKDLFKDREGGKWKTQLATDNSDYSETFFEVGFSAVNAKGEKIYVFLLKITDDNNDHNLEFRLVKGKVGSEEEDEEVNEGRGKVITWEKGDSSGLPTLQEAKEKLGKESLSLVLSDGSAFLTEDKKILCVVKGKFKENGEYVTLLLHFDEKDEDLELLHVESTNDWHSSFFQWEKKIFKAPTNGDGKSVMVFDADKKNFTKSSSPIVRLRDFFKDKNNFVTANIKEKEVLMFTQQEKKSGDEEKNDVNLWMTDGSRVGFVGTIVPDIKGPFYGSLLYTNDELFVLHQKNGAGEGEENKNVFSFTRLKEQLEKIKTILDVWSKSNDQVKEFYKDTAGKTIPCFTDGLVGFLSDTAGENNNDWKDEYLNVNATVTKGKGETTTKVPNGFTFSGDGAGAKWPVGKAENKDQPYNFTDPGFTLVATVAIEQNDEKRDNSLLGLVVNGENNRRVGLLCSEGKWAVKNEKEVLKTMEEEGGGCKKGRKYNVALVLGENENLEIYVDERRLTFFDGKKITINKKENIKHFYFGADDGEINAAAAVQSHVTITNVMLYNRPLKEGEIRELKPQQNDAEDIETATEKEDKQSPPPPPTTEDSAVRVGVVGMLCFMLFGVFALLGRYVY